MVGKALEKFVGQLRVKAADHAAFKRHMHHQPGAPGKINHHAAERFVQRYVGVTIAAQAFFIADRQRYGLAQGDADIFDRVVAVDVQVACGLDVQVDQPVAGNLIEHVVKKADTGGQA